MQETEVHLIRLPCPFTLADLFLGVESMGRPLLDAQFHEAPVPIKANIAEMLQHYYDFKAKRPGEGVNLEPVMICGIGRLLIAAIACVKVKEDPNILTSGDFDDGNAAFLRSVLFLFSYPKERWAGIKVNAGDRTFTFQMRDFSAAVRKDFQEYLAK